MGSPWFYSLDIFKTPSPTLTVRNNIGGVPSIPGVLASVFIVVVTVLFTAFQVTDLGIYTLTYQFKMPQLITKAEPVNLRD